MVDDERSDQVSKPPATLDRPTGKFLAYFELVEACAKPGCPVCRCLRESTLRSLDALLYEQVTDPATRASLGRSWGFCAWHAWLSREVRNAPLAIALIYQDLLDRVRDPLTATQRELARRPRVRGWRRLLRRAELLPLVRARAARQRCTLCRLLKSTEASYLHTLLDSIEEAEFDGAYRTSAGVCLPHLGLALASYPAHRGADALVAGTLGMLDQLATELRGFVEKHDYRAQAPFSDEEAAAWTKAVGFLVGDAALFGNEIGRRAGSPASAPAVSVPASAERGASGQPAPSGDARLQPLAAEKERLEQELRDLLKQLGDESSRAAALQYRLRIVEEDRKVLEMNLAGERGAARTWETVAQQLSAELAELKQRLARYETPAGTE
jgi:Family of unknown function (DUF6062)